MGFVQVLRMDKRIFEDFMEGRGRLEEVDLPYLKQKISEEDW